MKLNIIHLFLMLVLSACDLVMFKNPQPVDQTDIDSMPVHVRGEWASEYNVLRIYDNGYTHNAGTISKFTITNRKDTNILYKVIGDKLYLYNKGADLLNNIAELVVQDQIGDTIYYVDPDSMHYLSERIKLRAVGNNYMLSTSYDSKFWHVYYIDVADSVLHVMYLDNWQEALDSSKILFNDDEKDQLFTIEDLKTIDIIEQISLGYWDTMDTYYRVNKQ